MKCKCSMCGRNIDSDIEVLNLTTIEDEPIEKATFYCNSCYREMESL